jgi:hypothetical protein
MTKQSEDIRVAMARVRIQKHETDEVEKARKALARAKKKRRQQGQVGCKGGQGRRTI